MNRIFKTFPLWLLIAVLPLHAVAGVATMSCAPVPLRMSHEPMASAAPHHEMMGDVHAEHRGDHAEHATASPADEHSAHAPVEKQSHSSCSACSAFCLGAAAAPSSSLPVPTFDGSDAVVVAPPVLAVVFIQDGPQRPPRHPSA